MSSNLDKHPKTVNLDSSIPVNSQMKRVVKNNCSTRTTTNCIKQSYGIPIAGQQIQSPNWGTIAGINCKGRISFFPYNGMHASACITNYNGINNVNGLCQISHTALAEGYWKNFNRTQSGRLLASYNITALTNVCQNNCQYNAKFINLNYSAPTVELLFTACTN